jgi:hyperosmotically inducible periplasmic protein
MAPLCSPRPAGASRPPLLPVLFLMLLAIACASHPPPQTQTLDAQIATELAARLAADSRLNRFDLTLRVTDGVVGLSGAVDDETLREHAGELALRIAGVGEVVNELEVVAPASEEATRDDAGITARVRSKLAADPELDRSQIGVHTDAGTVTLAGRVATSEERRRAEQAARDTSGVRTVRNLLEVGEPIDG